MSQPSTLNDCRRWHSLTIAEIDSQAPRATVGLGWVQDLAPTAWEPSDHHDYCRTSRLGMQRWFCGWGEAWWHVPQNLIFHRCAWLWAILLYMAFLFGGMQTMMEYWMMFPKIDVPGVQLFCHLCLFCCFFWGNVVRDVVTHMSPQNEPHIAACR